MKTLLKLLPLFLCASLFAQVPPFLRNRWTTNADVIIQAGSGIAITTNSASNFTFSVVSSPFNSTNTQFYADSVTAPFGILISNIPSSNPLLTLHNSSNNGNEFIRMNAGNFLRYWDIQGSTNYWSLLEFTANVMSHQRNSNVTYFGNNLSTFVFGTNVSPATPNTKPINSRFLILSDSANTNPVFNILVARTNVFALGSNGYPKMTVPGSGAIIAIDDGGFLFKTNVSGGGSTQMVAAAIGSLTTTNTMLVGADATAGVIQLREPIGNTYFDLATTGDGELYLGDVDAPNVFLRGSDFAFGGSGGSDGVIRVWDSTSGEYIQALSADEDTLNVGVSTDASVINGSAVTVFTGGVFWQFTGGLFKSFGDTFVATNSNGGFATGTNNFRVDALGLNYLNGQVFHNIVSNQANFFLGGPTNSYVTLFTAGGARTVTLTNTGIPDGFSVRFKNAGTNGNNVTINRTGTDLLDFQTSMTLTNMQSVELVKQGTNWLDFGRGRP